MDERTRELIEAVHAAPTRAVLAVSGAGSQALAWLLGVGGASRTVLEATIPYAQPSFIAYAGTTPGEFASSDAAVALARAALDRARALTEEASIVGIGCAATIATDRLKRGEHRAYIAACEGARTRVWGLHLEKGARDRAGEEDLVSRVVVNALAEVFGLEARLPLGLRPGEELTESEA